jgi:chemotaxis response regulator CheB
MKIRALVIDDDAFTRELFSDVLEKYFPDIDLLGMAGSGK